MRRTTTRNRRAVLVATIAALAACLAPRVARAESAEALYGEGLRVLHEQGVGGMERAVSLFRDAVKADASFVEARQALADALITRYEFSSEKNREWLDEALVGLDEVLRMRPADAKAYLSRATACLDLGDRERAGRELRKALLIAPGNAEIGVAWFSYLLDEGRTDEAAAFALKSLDTFATGADMLALFGDGFMAAGRADIAAEYFGRALRVEDRDARLNLRLGDALRESGDLKAAVAQYDRAIEINGSLEEARLAAGYCRGAMGEYEKAIELTKKYLAAVPDDISALNNLALFYERAGQADAAREAWSRLRDLPSAPASYRARAEEHLK